LNKEKIVVVLVEPQGELNIGSVARAMLNFGVSELRLVNPVADHLSRDARLLAVKAASVLESAKTYSSLNDALADCAVCFGTTRRFGQYRDRFKYPDEAAQILIPIARQQTSALVFGREDKGLLTAELDLCQHLITIPTSDELPSMNLAQSVVLCLYEVNKVRGEIDGCQHDLQSLAVNAELESMFQHMKQSMTNIGYLNQDNPDHILRTFRKIFGRSELNSREVNILRGLFNQIDLYSGKKMTRKQMKEGVNAQLQSED
jgi:tRNA/rRNA methyltransferase